MRSSTGLGLSDIKAHILMPITLGHNAGFAMMLTVVYVAFRKSQRVPLRWAEIMVLARLHFLVSISLFAPQVRSVYWG
jgi:hypothetical protein